MQPNATNLTEHLEVRVDTAFLKLAGCVPVEAAVDAVTRAIIAMRGRGIRRLLVDGSRLTGFSSPSVADRYFISRCWAEAAEKQVALALVLQQHLIDPDRFGIVVATNLGMRANVFSSPADAEEWLFNEQEA